MRFVMMFGVLILSFIINVNETRNLKFEREVYNLYTNSFYDFIYIDRNKQLKVDLDGIGKIFLSNGQEVTMDVKDNTVCLKKKTDNIFDKTSKYCFYMVKSNDLE